jgi:hypothetical protein
MILCRENEIYDVYKNEKLHDSNQENITYHLSENCSLYFVDNLPSFKLAVSGYQQ